MSKILELLFPSRCVICNSPGIQLCALCSSSITPSFRKAEITGLELCAGALYGDVVSQLILMAKEENIAAARNVLVDLLVDAYVKLDMRGVGNQKISLIPIPSSQSANRKRGYRHSYLLAQGVRERFRRDGNMQIEIAEVLKVNRKISDMSKLTKEQRATNISQAYSINPRGRAGEAEGKVLILLDDLVTTGSSMMEAVRCLRAAKMWPLGAISAGVSPHLIS